MQFSRAEVIFLSVLVAVTVICSGYLYYDFNRGVQAGKGKVIGILTFKQKTVQRKYTGQVIWEELEQKVKVQNRDSIRTAANSDAEITLNDGTKIQLDENSMIVLNLSEDKANINFAYGSVQAKQSKTAKTALTLKTGDKTISIKDSDIKLSKTKKQEDVAVTVQRGSAEVKSGNQTQKIKKDEKAVISAKKIQVKKIALKSITPPDNSRYFTTKRYIPISFSFRKDSQVKSVTIQLSTNRRFSNIIGVSKISGTKLTKSLKSGIYYWRVKTRNESSEIRKVSIIQNTPVKLIMPANRRKFNYTGDKPYISFAWSKNKVAQNYRLEISKNSKFTSILHTVTTQINSFSKTLGNGSYYWRITAVDPTGSGSVISAPKSFIIRKQEILNPPNLFNPQRGIKVYSVLAEQKGLPFNWSSSRTYSAYEFLLSANSSFSATKVRKRVSNSFFELRKKLSAGTYYWKVRGISRSGKRSSYSASSYLIVQNLKSMKLRYPRSGQTFNENSTRLRGIAFKWEKLPVIGRYEIIFSRKRNFRKIAAKQLSSYNHALVTKLPGGTFYWKVRFLDTRGKAIIASNISMIKIIETVVDPVLYSPSSGSILNLKNKKSVRFKWSNVGRTKEYRFKLYRERYGSKRAGNLFALFSG